MKTVTKPREPSNTKGRHNKKFTICAKEIEKTLDELDTLQIERKISNDASRNHDCDFA